MYIYFLLFDLLSAKFITFEETRKKCNKHDPKVIKERYDVFKGYSEEIIPVNIDIKNEVMMNIPKKYFNDSSVIRFKVIGWDHESYIYVSKFYINNIPCEVEDAKNLLEFYSKVIVLTNKDENFNKKLYQFSYNSVNSRVVCDNITDSMRRSIEKKLFKVYEKKSSFEGDNFELFKLICVTLLEETYSKNDITKTFRNFSKKKVSEIYSVPSILYQVIQDANKSLEYATIIQLYGKDFILKEFIKEL